MANKTNDKSRPNNQSSTSRGQEESKAQPDPPSDKPQAATGSSNGKLLNHDLYLNLARGGRKVKTSARLLSRRVITALPERRAKKPMTQAERGQRVSRNTRVSVAVGSLLLALVFYLVLIRTAPQVEPETDGARPPQVPVMRIEPVSLARSWQAMGTIEAEHQASVPARVTATVQQVIDGIDEGRRVAKGDLLVKLDPSDFSQQVASAQQKLEQLQAQLSELEVRQQRLSEQQDLDEQTLAVAKRDVQRLQKIYQGQATTRQDLDAARTRVLETQRALNTTRQQLDTIPAQRAQLQAQIEAQQANLRLAELNRERASIVSPIAGIIDQLAVDEGENVRRGQMVANIVDLRTLEARLNLPAAARSEIAVGANLTIRSAAQPDQTWQAKVTRLQPTNDPQSRTMRVYATIQQPEALQKFGQPAGADLLSPGTFVTAWVQSTNRARKWAVPRRAVRNGRIFVVHEGVVESEAVNVDYSVQRTFDQYAIADDQWVILKREPGSQSQGLASGDQVVLNVATSLREGQRVEPTPVGAENKSKPDPG